jgi:hypothetical protein
LKTRRRKGRTYPKEWEKVEEKKGNEENKEKEEDNNEKEGFF